MVGFSLQQILPPTQSLKLSQYDVTIEDMRSSLLHLQGRHYSCEMLNVLEGYSLGKLGFHSAASLHPTLEAMLYAYFDRNTYLGDPDFVKNPVERLISKQYAAQIRTKILATVQLPSTT
jgi:gamma-glutamyltranspeptidase